MKKRNLHLAEGTIIRGKWHHRSYKVIRLLGSGTVGSVYLCRSKGQYVALKISGQSLSMTAEVQALKMLQQTKVQDSGLGPYLLDVDDWEIDRNKTVAFYAMEYVEGVSIRSFVRRYGSAWITPLLLQLLDQLERLHKVGYVFGDLKSDNIMVTANPPTVRLIDVGGMTKMGRAVKEYTNFYDRAYWRLGKRTAEPSYDLFASAMVILAIFYPRKFKREKDSMRLLRQRLLRVKSIRTIAPVLLRGLSGSYRDVRTMRMDLMKRTAFSKNGERSKSIATLMMELILVSGCAGIYYGIYSLLMHMS